MVNEEKYFAAFVMTYERPFILKETIYKLLSQSLPPQKILIIDNSSSNNTENMLLSEKFNSETIISYYKTGENIGPAGASEIALKILVKEGYQWIYWGDDDDPPLFNNVCEQLLDITKSDPSIGIAGAVGHLFNKHKGQAHRLSDQELIGNGIIDIDIIAGNMNILVNANIIKAGILPNPKLFLNIEEYDFCLRAKAVGFRVVVSKKIFSEYREKHNRFNVPLKPISGFPKQSVLWRRYYTTRNLIYILRNNENSLIGAICVTARAFAKIILGYQNGLKYGKINAKMEWLGIYHGWFNLMGRRVNPVSKYS